MSWAKRVKTKKVNRASPLVLEEGEHFVEVVKEPDDPVTTRFGERLIYEVIKKGESEIKAFFIPFREETSESSALGQLKALTDKYGSLQGRLLKIVVAGKGRAKRYSISLVKQAKLEAKCPNCNQSVTQGMKFCPNCGQKLS